MRTVVTPIAVAIPVAVVHTDRFTVFEVQDVIMSRDHGQLHFCSSFCDLEFGSIPCRWIFCPMLRSASSGRRFVVVLEKAEHTLPKYKTSQRAN